MAYCYPNVNAEVRVYDNREAAPQDVQRVSSEGDISVITADASGRAYVNLFADRFASQADVTDAMNMALLNHYGVDLIIGKEAMLEIGDRIILESQGIGADPVLARIVAEEKKRHPTSATLGLARAVLGRVLADPNLQGAGINNAVARARAALVTAGVKPPSGQLTAADLYRMMSAIKAYAEAAPNTDAAMNAAYRAKQAAHRIADAPAKSGQVQRTLDLDAKMTDTWFTRMGRMQGDDRAPLLNLQRIATTLIKGDYVPRIWNLVKALPNKAQNAMGRTRNRYYDPLFNAMREEGNKIGQKLDEVKLKMDDYLQARHATERNERLWAMKVDLLDAGAAADRVAILKNAAARGLGWRDYGKELVALVTPSAKVPLSAARYAGMTNGEASYYIREYNMDPEFAAVRATLPLMDAALREFSIDRIKSGVVPESVVNLYGYDYYVPLRGRRLDSDSLTDGELVRAMKLDNRTLETLSDVRRVREAKGRGEEGTADDIFNTVFYDHMDSVRRRESQSFLREVGETFTRLRNNPDKPVSLGRVVPDGNLDWDSANQRFISDGLRDKGAASAYNVIPFLGADGQTYSLITTDPQLAAAIAEIVAPSSKALETAPIIGTVGRITSRYGQLLTRFNPYFWNVQFARDVLNNSVTLLANTAGITGLNRLTATVQFNKHLGLTLSDPRLRQFMFAKHESLRSALLDDKVFRDERSVFADFVEDGARTRIANQYGALKAESQHTELAGRVETAVEYFTRYQEGLEIAHRYAFYKTLREQGFDRESAAAQTVQLMDFNQRSTASRAFNVVYPFSHVINAAFSRFAGQAIWKDAQPPTKVTVLPSGRVTVTLDWAAVPAALNTTVGVAATLMGYLASQMMDSALGNDEDGSSVYAKQTASSLIRNFLVPGFDGEDPIQLPLPDNAFSMLFVAGVLGHRNINGYDDNESTMYALMNTGIFYAGPLGKGSVQLNDLAGTPDSEALPADVLAGYVPAVAVPLYNWANNRDRLGTTLDNRGQEFNFEGARGELRGAAATTDKARAYEGAVTEYLNLSGDVIRELVTGYGGFLGSLYDKQAQAEYREQASGDPKDQANFINDLLLPLSGLRENRSGNFYSYRAMKEAQEPFAQLNVALAEAKREDLRNGEGGQMVNGVRKRGPRVAAMLDADPALNYYIDYQSKLARDEQKDPNYKLVGTYQQQIDAARGQGNDALVNQLITERDLRTEEQRQTYQNLWKARAAWIDAGSNPADWPGIAAEYALPPVKPRKPR